MDDTTLGIIIVAMVVLVIYFIPTIIAFARSSSYAWVIFVLNLMGGWTGIAWFAAFIWALWPKGHSAASIDVNLNHRGAVDMGTYGLSDCAASRRLFTAHGPAPASGPLAAIQQAGGSGAAGAPAHHWRYFAGRVRAAEGDIAEGVGPRLWQSV